MCEAAIYVGAGGGRGDAIAKNTLVSLADPLNLLSQFLLTQHQVF